jgi:integrase
LKRLYARAYRIDVPVCVTPHAFRRSCNTELTRRGVNLWRVKELLTMSTSMHGSTT